MYGPSNGVIEHDLEWPLKFISAAENFSMVSISRNTSYIETNKGSQKLCMIYYLNCCVLIEKPLQDHSRSYYKLPVHK